jgi:hypothetical protein
MFAPMRDADAGAVDLRPHCPPVMDQGELGSCTAHGITGALRYEMKRAGQPDVPLSRLQLYFDERAIEGTVLRRRRRDPRRHQERGQDRRRPRDAVALPDPEIRSKPPAKGLCRREANSRR